MVTGDHIETAARVAVNAGIITESEMNEKFVCMTGSELQNILGEVRKEV